MVFAAVVEDRARFSTALTGLRVHHGRWLAIRQRLAEQLLHLLAVGKTVSAAMVVVATVVERVDDGCRTVARTPRRRPPHLPYHREAQVWPARDHDAGRGFLRM